ALINSPSEIPTHQKKTVYLCQLLIRIAEGKSLELQFEKDQKISPLESALSFWTLLEREEVKLEKLHEDIHRLIKIQIVAVYMESRYYKEAAEVLERLFTDSESDKPLRVKLATIIKSKDPYVPLLQNFSYRHLISKVKSYIKPFMKESETNILIQEATKQVVSKELTLADSFCNAVAPKENDQSYLETEQRFVLSIILLRDIHGHLLPQRDDIVSAHGCVVHGRLLRCSLTNLQNVEQNGVTLACARRKQRWTFKEDLELKSGVRKFGVGNWAKILVHGNFNNRTSVMLKDRWRTLHNQK
ncbi:Telomeric repeat-binding factor 1, partial [Acanthisitta chloris]